MGFIIKHARFLFSFLGNDCPFESLISLLNFEEHCCLTQPADLCFVLWLQSLMVYVPL